MKNKIFCVMMVLTLLASMFGFAMDAKNAYATVWVTKTPMPSTRTSAAAGVINSILYIAGGHTGTTGSDTLQAYNAATDTWSTLAPMPQGRYRNVAGVIGDKLYVVGGWYGTLPHPELYVYDPVANSWSTKLSMPILSGSGACGVINGKLYVVTPCDGYNGYREFLHVYDPIADTWDQLASSPYSHVNPAFGVIDNKLYVAGGLDDSGNVHAQLDVYDPSTNTWTTQASIPTPIVSLACGTVFDGKLYAIGGSNGASTIYNSVYIYDPVTNIWTTGTSMLTARTCAAAAVINNVLYVVGGGDSGGTVIGTNEAFTFGTPTTSSISGYVYEVGSATPIEGAVVKAFDFSQQWPLQAPPVAEVTTDGNGHYIITGLPAGDYRLSSVATNHERRFQPDTLFWTQAQAVTVVAGQETSGKNFNLGPGGTISGVIKNANGTQTLANISVFASLPGALGVAIVETDENGNYTLEGLSYNTYYVGAPASLRLGSGDDNYVREYWQEKSIQQQANGVIVSAGVNPDNINLTLEQGGSISGHVYETGSNTPIVGATVTAFVGNTIDDTRQLFEGTSPYQATTDINGHYIIAGLPEGAWALTAIASGHERRYYPDTIYINLAQPVVVVVGGQDTPGKDFHLGPGGTISGTVTDQDTGDLLPDVSVYAALSQGSGIAFTITDEHGNYTLEGLPYNNYAVASPVPFQLGNGDNGYIMEVWQEKTYANQPDMVEVSQNSNPTGIDFSLEVGATISGNVYQADGTTALPSAEIQVFDYATSGYRVFRSMAFTDLQGYYTTGGLPDGQYSVRATASGYATEWYDNTYFSQDNTAVTITNAGNVTGKDFILGPGGSISGTVTTDATPPQPIANMNVYAMDYTSGKWMNGAITGTNGTYTLSGLPAGTYRLSTYARTTNLNYIDEYYDNTQDYNAAQQVTVTAGQNTADKNFSLAAGATVSGTVLDQSTNAPVEDMGVGSINLNAGWHKFVYRQEEATGGSSSRAAFKAPGDTAWRRVSTSELNIRTAADAGSASGITLTNKKNSWGDTHPKTHWELVRCVETESTQDAGWYGQSVVDAVNQESNIHGNDDYFTSYYEGYINVTTPGTWYFATDSDDASEIVIDGQIVAFWYDGHGASNKWEHKVKVSIEKYATGEYLKEVAANDDGTYTITGIPDGSWRLLARASGYASEYFQEAGSSNQATEVILSAGQNETGKNFTLAKGGSISGTVIADDDQQPIGGIYVFAFSSSTNRVADTETAADGTYTIRGIPAGALRVKASPSLSNLPFAAEWYDNTYNYDASQQVIVTSGQDTPGKNFSLAPGGDISGTVTAQVGGATLANVSVQARRTIDTSTWFGAISDSQGNYSIRFLPYGDYIVRSPNISRPGSGDNGFPTEYYNNQTSEGSANTVTIGAGSSPTGVNFTLDSGGFISGHVYESNGTTAISGATVWVKDFSTRQEKGKTTTGADGSYTISGLPSGQYRVEAWATNHVRRFWQNTLSGSSATAVSITAPNGATDIDFSLEAGGTISGKVTAQVGGANLANISVDANRTDGPGGWGATTDQNGNYTITGLAFGEYRVGAPQAKRSGSGDDGYAREYYNNKTTSSNADLVAISAGSPDATGKDFSLEIGGTISGTVIADVGGQPIINLHVYAEDYNTREWLAGTFTDTNGNYTLSGLNTGTYRVRACPSNNNLPYADEYYDNTYNNGTPQAVSVTVGQNTSGKNFSLAPGGSISGTVRNAGGTATLANVSVEVRRPADGSNTWWWGASTDSNGNYILCGLPYGDYIVRSPTGGRWGTGDDSYFTEYYNNQSSEGNANTVTVASGTNPTGKDFTLAQGGTISGNVVEAGTNDPLSGVQVQVFQSDPLTGRWFGKGQCTTDAQGHYVTSPLSTGDYYLRIYMPKYLSEYYDGVLSSGSATAVHVEAPAETQNKNFILEQGGFVSGHVYQPGGTTPLSGASIELIEYSSLPGAWVTQGWATTDSQGLYVTTGVATGNYGIRVTASGYATEFWDNTYFKDQATSVTVTSPAETANKDFTMGPGGAITGTVTDEGQQPIANCHVQAFDTATQLFVAAVDTDSTGNYTLSGLPAGSYQVRAYASYRGLPYANEWYDNTYFRSQATSIAVTASQTTSGKNFVLAAGGSISGYVRKESDNSAISGASVSIYRNSDMTSYGSVSTDANGYYKFSGLASDQYIVRVNATNFASEWYDNVYPLDHATPVVVNAPAERDNTNFSLVPGSRITGHVYQSNGTTGIVGGRVWVYNSDGLVCGGAITTTGGSYTTSGLIAGQYKLRAEASGYASEWYDNVYAEGQATGVTVTVPGDTTNKDFILETGTDTPVTISPESQEVSPGQTFTVEVKVDPKVAIAGVQFDLTFDPSLLTVNSVTEGNLLKQGGASTYFAMMNTIANANTTGTIKATGVTIGEGQTVSTLDTFAIISMTAKTVETQGTSQLNLSNVKVGDAGGNAVPISVTDGDVTVMPYDDWDVNTDRNVDVFDLILVGQNWGKTGTPHWIRADVKRDGVIDVFDMILIGQHWTG